MVGIPCHASSLAVSIRITFSGNPVPGAHHLRSPLESLPRRNRVHALCGPLPSSGYFEQRALAVSPMLVESCPEFSPVIAHDIARPQVAHVGMNACELARRHALEVPPVNLGPFGPSAQNLQRSNGHAGSRS